MMIERARSRDALPSVEVTIDYREGDGLTGPMARIPAVFIAGTGPSPTGDVQALLRRRLRFLGLFGTGVFGVLSIFLTASLFQTDSQPGEGYRSFILQVTIMAAVLGGLTGLVWSRRPLSLRQLRLIELALYVVVLAQIVRDRYLDLIDFGLAQSLLEGPPFSHHGTAPLSACPLLA